MIIALSILFFSAPDSCALEIDAGSSILSYRDSEQLKLFNQKVRMGGFSFGFSKKTSTDLNGEVSKKVAQICGRVQEILEMSPKGMKFRIQLLDTKSDVQKIYLRQYQRKVDFIAFYSPRTKTVYFSLKDINLKVFAHEVAHAIIDHYFDKAPPVKIHEMLAQYVEKQL